MIRPSPKDWLITEVSQNRKVLITSVNNPRVKTINPQLRNFNRGPTKAFTRPKIKAIQSRETTPPDRSRPGRIQTARYKATALIASRMINFVIAFPLSLFYVCIRQGNREVASSAHPQKGAPRI